MMKFKQGDKVVVTSGFAKTVEDALVMVMTSDDPNLCPHQVPIGSIVEIDEIDLTDARQPYGVTIEIDGEERKQWLMEQQVALFQ